MRTRRQFLGGDGEIASAIVYPLPGRRDSLRRALGAVPGVGIHTETLDGRFIVTVESTAGSSAGDGLLKPHNLEGVSAVALVAHYENV